MSHGKDKHYTFRLDDVLELLIALLQPAHSANDWSLLLLPDLVANLRMRPQPLGVPRIIAKLIEIEAALVRSL